MSSSHSISSVCTDSHYDKRCLSIWNFWPFVNGTPLTLLVIDKIISVYIFFFIVCIPVHVQMSILKQIPLFSSPYTSVLAIDMLAFGPVQSAIPVNTVFFILNEFCDFFMSCYKASNVLKMCRTTTPFYISPFWTPLDKCGQLWTIWTTLEHFG